MVIPNNGEECNNQISITSIINCICYTMPNVERIQAL